ncbi:MAG: Crp/Fnr family transcriptional regulator [Geminicoccaceae bacterium]
MLEGIAKPTDRAKFGPRNWLLAALLPENLRSLRPHLERVPLVDGRVLFEASEPITRVYFVEAGVVSLTAAFQNGSTAEMATVGREGVVGVNTLLGSDAALGRYLVQVPGSALAVEASRFQGALRTTPALLAICQAYARAFLGQALQTAACNSVHTVEQRCARWLLMSHDRRDSDTFALKQEMLAKMLGVCRPTATVAAGTLQRAGLIRYSRGVVTVLDRPGLEGASCECYRVICAHFERLLPCTYQRPLERAYGRPHQPGYERPHERAYGRPHERSHDRPLSQAFG